MKPDVPDPPDRRQLEVALGAAARVRVGGWLLVAACLAAALVDVARHQPRPAHGPPEDQLELRLLPEHLPVRRREHQVGRRGPDRLLKVVGQKFAVDRDGIGAAILRRLAIVRSADRDDPRRQIHVCLAKREQLAFAQTGVDRHREERPPLRLHGRQQGWHLVRPQIVRQPLRYLALRHVRDWVRSRVLLHPTTHVEGPAEKPAQVIHALRAQLSLLLAQKEIDLSRADVLEIHAPDVLRPDQMLPDGGDR
ncbi:MAG TPA: hypothetical protein VFH68_06205 [Polyangia bacterium]|nr:hypothetical protein [Polyangia bacterium]